MQMGQPAICPFQHIQVIRSEARTGRCVPLRFVIQPGHEAVFRFQQGIHRIKGRIMQLRIGGD